MTINWEILVAAIAAIETGSTDLSRTAAEGPERSRGVGPLQIHQCVVDEVNRLQKTTLKLSDMASMDYAAFVCKVYLGYWAARLPNEPTITDLARIWNGGPYGPVKASTADYGRRVAAMYDSIQKDRKLDQLFSTAAAKEGS